MGKRDEKPPPRHNQPVYACLVFRALIINKAEFDGCKEGMGPAKLLRGGVYKGLDSYNVAKEARAHDLLNRYDLVLDPGIKLRQNRVAECLIVDMCIQLGHRDAA